MTPLKAFACIIQSMNLIGVIHADLHRSVRRSIAPQ